MKNNKARIFIDGKEVNVEKVKQPKDPLKDRAQDHVLDQMQVGPIKRVVYKKLLDVIDEFIDEKFGPQR